MLRVNADMPDLWYSRLTRMPSSSPRKPSWVTTFLSRGWEIVNTGRLPLFSLALAVVLGSLGALPPERPDASADSGQGQGPRTSFGKDVVPFLTKHCYSCHGGGKNQGDLTLDKYQDEQAIVKDREVWENVVEMVRTGEMPPKAKGRPRPTPSEVELATRAIDDMLERFDCTRAARRRPRHDPPAQPGRV